MKGLLKKIIVMEDCIFFLSHADDMKLEILKPIPIPRIVKLIRQIGKENKNNEYLNTDSFLNFLEKSVNTDPDFVKEMKEDIIYE
jgi:DNA-directed RNA polymerase subunit F